MKKSTWNEFLDTIEEAGRFLAGATRRAARAIAVMSWPQMAVTCVCLALMLSILPLAFVLFVIFMGIKLIVASLVLSRRRPRNEDVIVENQP